MPAAIPFASGRPNYGNLWVRKKGKASQPPAENFSGPSPPCPLIPFAGARKNGATQVNDTLRKFLALREGAKRYHKKLIGDVDPYHCWADWLSKVWREDHQGIRKQYGTTLDFAFGPWLDRSGCRSKAALSESAGGASGEDLVPPELSYDLMGDVSEEAFIRPLAVVQHMTSATLTLSYPDATTTTGTAGVPQAKELPHLFAQFVGRVSSALNPSDPFRAGPDDSALLALAVGLFAGQHCSRRLHIAL